MVVEWQAKNVMKIQNPNPTLPPVLRSFPFSPTSTKVISSRKGAIRAPSHTDPAYNSHAATPSGNNLSILAASLRGDYDGGPTG